MTIFKYNFKLSPKILCLILLLINIALVLFYFNAKEGFHSDEQWSYAHANSSQGAYLDNEIDSFYQITDSIKSRLFYHWIEGKTFNNYLTVQEGERFSYQNIYNNLKIVEHPPLYFILLHTVSSFTLDYFSKWHAGGLNLIFFILIYIMLYKSAVLVLKDEWAALCCTVLWGFSEIGLDTVMFLRMYILQTLLSLCLFYQTLRMLIDNKADNKDLFLIFLYSSLGILTHYNSIFFSFFVALCCGIILLKRRNYHLLWRFGGVMFLSVAVLFIIFPPAIDVLFGSLRGKQVLSNIRYASSFGDDFMNLFYGADLKIAYMAELLSEHFFAFDTTYYKVIAFLLIFGSFLCLYFKIKMNMQTKYLLSVVGLYFLYLLAMPYMYIFHSRYYMSLLPLWAILLILTIRQLLLFARFKKKQATVILLFLITLNSLNTHFMQTSPYAFRYGKAETETLDKFKKNDVLIDSGNNVIFLHSIAYYLANAERVFITDDICNGQSAVAIEESKTPVVLTYASYIRSANRKPKISCLEEKGLHNSVKICASQHCYNVWIK